MPSSGCTYIREADELEDGVPRRFETEGVARSGER